MASASDVLKVARAEIGVKECPADSNKVKYNEWLYKRPVEGASYPWCAAFVSWVFAQVDAELCKKTASCQEMGDWFRSKGRWKRAGAKAGDVVFFKFSTNARWTNHVGIVESVNPDGSINTIEGNTSIKSQDNGGAVMARVRKSNIVGYGCPNYDTVQEYFPSCAQSCKSIVDALKSLGIDSSREYRDKIAIANGLNYNATIADNLYLLKLLKAGILIKP